jgi:hypothetical protein
MKRKAKLARRAAKAGAAWAWAWGDHAGRVLVFYGLLVGSGSVSAVQVGWWGPVVAVVAFALFALAVGGLNEWDAAEQSLALDKQFQNEMRDFRERCYKHIADVERFLEVRKMEGPPAHADLATALRTANTPEGKQRREEGQRHERETVAQFLASEHRDRGTRYFDLLHSFGCIVDTGRPHVADPKTVSQIEDGIDTIRWAVERLPVY